MSLRSGFLKGAMRHLRYAPRIVWSVRGWPLLLMDCLGWRKAPYQVAIRNARVELRPGTSDWWIFLEIFIFEIYGRAAQEIRKAKTILDVGSNVGMFAVYAALANRTARIHAFEPFPENLRQLERNLQLSGLNRVKTHPCAVSDTAGVATLFFSSGDSSGCSLNQTGNDSCSVETVAGDTLLEKCGVETCDLLKMDCEGSELGILQSLRPETLSRIGAIVMEYHDPSQVTTIVKILHRAGFQSEIIEPIHTIFSSREERWNPSRTGQAAAPSHQ